MAPEPERSFVGPVLRAEIADAVIHAFPADSFVTPPPPEVYEKATGTVVFAVERALKRREAARERIELTRGKALHGVIWDEYAEYVEGAARRREAELDSKLHDAIDGLVLAVNGLITYGVVRWSVARRGGPDWAGVNLGRIAAVVAMSPSRQPQARELREKVQRAFGNRRGR